MSLDIKIEKKSPWVVYVYLKGSLDSNTYQQLEKELDPVFKEIPEVIVFDLKNLDFISSLGLRIIAKTKKFLQNNNGEVNMVNLKPHIQEVFNIIDAIGSDKVFSSTEELDKYLEVRQAKNKERQKNN